MPMEAETLKLLNISFFLIITVCFGVIIKLWFKSKNNGLAWFIAQLIFLVFSFLKFIELIKPNTDIPTVFLSEENSLALGITGVLWAGSMLCMIVGIWSLNRNINKDF